MASGRTTTYNDNVEIGGEDGFEAFEAMKLK